MFFFFFMLLFLSKYGYELFLGASFDFSKSNGCFSCHDRSFFAIFNRHRCRCFLSLLFYKSFCCYGNYPRSNPLMAPGSIQGVLGAQSYHLITSSILVVSSAHVKEEWCKIMINKEIYKIMLIDNSFIYFVLILIHEILNIWIITSCLRSQSKPHYSKLSIALKYHQNNTFNISISKPILKFNSS